MPERLKSKIGADGMSTGSLLRRSHPSVPVKKRIFLIRCGDDDKFDRCCSDKYDETPMQHFSSLYEICYQHTEPGCCLCMNEGLRFPWQDPEHMYQRLALLMPVKKPDYICLISHSECAAYGARTEQLTPKKELELHQQDLLRGRGVIKGWFQKSPQPVKTLLFFLDRNHELKAVDEETLEVHKAQLKSQITS